MYKQIAPTTENWAAHLEKIWKEFGMIEGGLGQSGLYLSK
jgi:hypothetical protein